MAIMNSTGLHHYFYDHTVQRVLKGTLRSVSGAINGSQSYQDLIMDEYVVYVNPFYTVTHYNDHTEATKHYYMNAQRVATSVISYMSSSTQLPASYEPFEPETPGTVNVIATIIDKLFDWEILAYPSAEINFQHILEPIDLELLYPSSYYNYDIEPCETDPRCMCEQSQYYSKVLHDIDCYQINITYWYHPDYLGSIEWVTNADGRPVEYFWYSPWGETLQEDNSWRGRFSSPFKFTGHIEDGETGLTYAGARYYPARVGKWLSVDPLAHEFPAWTPYNYTMNNPVNMVDPDGRAPDDILDDDNNPRTFLLTIGHSLSSLSKSSKERDRTTFSLKFENSTSLDPNSEVNSKIGSELSLTRTRLQNGESNLTGSFKIYFQNERNIDGISKWVFNLEEKYTYNFSNYNFSRTYEGKLYLESQVTDVSFNSLRTRIGFACGKDNSVFSQARISSVPRELNFSGGHNVNLNGSFDLDRYQFKFNSTTDFIQRIRFLSTP
jgi:RHS repeat-associated protein